MLVRCKVGVAPREYQQPRRVPDANLADFEDVGSALSVEGFEQPAAHPGFHRNEARPRRGVSEFNAAPPPSIDIAGENLERRRRCNCDRNADFGGGAAHDFCLRARWLCSAYALNACSWRRHASSTSASHDCTGAK